jgi:hypothetical protein
VQLSKLPAPSSKLISGQFIISAFSRPTKWHILSSFFRPLAVGNSFIYVLFWVLYYIFIYVLFWVSYYIYTLPSGGFIANLVARLDFGEQDRGMKNWLSSWEFSITWCSRIILSETARVRLTFFFIQSKINYISFGERQIQLTNFLQREGRKFLIRSVLPPTCLLSLKGSCLLSSRFEWAPLNHNRTWQTTLPLSCMPIATRGLAKFASLVELKLMNVT